MRYELPCAIGQGCGGDCESKAGTYMGHEFKRCPVRDVSEDWRIRAVVEVDKSIQLGSAWHADAYAAWVPEYLMQLREARADRQRQEAGRRG